MPLSGGEKNLRLDHLDPGNSAETTVENGLKECLGRCYK